jgi:digeranylgeranylglycerophospholipid reductase
MRCDLAVIGGGPAGCFTAAHVSRSFSVVILEEHEQVGIPEQCAGLIAPRVVDMAHARDSIINRIDGASIHFPGGRDLLLKGAETKAYVVDRRRFDERCLDLATANGAVYRSGSRFLEYHHTKEGLTLALNQGDELQTRLAIGAEGYKSTLGKQSGLPAPMEFIKGIQVDLRHRMEDQRSVDVWLGRDIAPGFFAWRIPCEDMTRLGLGTISGRPSDYLKKLVTAAGHDRDERIRLYSGMIPVGVLPKTVTDRIMLVGDAAAQVKPISGGGLYPGLTAARLAGQVASEALDEDDLSEKRLRAYDRAWKSEIGKDLDRGNRVRKAFLRMDDHALDTAGKLLDTEEARAVLSTGDIDHPTRIAKELLGAAPGLMRFAPQLLATMFSR